VLLLLGGTSRKNLISPGELTFQHGTVTQSCTSCHALVPNEPTNLVEVALTPDKALMQNQLCLKCHMLGENAAQAHGLSPAHLKELKQKVRREPGNAPLLLAAAQFGLGVPESATGELGCATCHAEHKGGQFKLAQMDNQRCQACHTRQFASLANGHPEFTDYPFSQRPSLFFDHESHLGRHFKDFRTIMPGGKAPTTCQGCHDPDPTGRMMLVKPFEQSCASCHLPQVLDVTLGGIRFLNLPAIDLETLRRHEQLSRWVEPMTAATVLPGQDPTLGLVLAGLFRDDRLVVQPPFAVGEWPDTAFGEPTPFAQLLLAAEPNYAKARAALQGVDLADLRRADPRQIRAAGDTLWAIKGCFYDIIQEGQPGLTTRFQRVAGPSVTAEQLTLMTGDLPIALVREAQEHWLPSLRTEVPAHRGNLPIKDAPIPGALALDRQLGEARWQRNDQDCSLQYLPRRHTDLFLRTWLDVASTRNAPENSAAFALVFDTLSSPFAPGRCGKCHSVEARADGSRSVNWLTAHPVAGAHSITTFAHQPHFSVVGDASCGACHGLRVGSRFAESFRLPNGTLNTDPKHFESNFVPMSKSQCTSCHTPTRAGDQCQQCHKFHVGSFSPFKMPVLDLERLPAHPVSSP
jgi:hypothetical protein